MFRRAVQRTALPAAALFRNSMPYVVSKSTPKRVFAITIGVGIVGGTSAALCEQKATAGKEGGGPKDEDEYADISNLQTWDSNWDGRAPEPGAPKSKAVRYLVLIRHGHYEEPAKTDEKRTLTALGRQQARILGKYLSLMPWTPTRLIVSDMTRAQQTFDIILNQLPKNSAPILVLPSLREGRPCQPVPFSPRSGRYKRELVERDGARIDEAFRTLFHRAPPDQTEDSYDVVVCHANVIRYFVCKALQVPTEAWLRISLAHCSTTVVAIHPSGHVVLRSLGNTHHIPPHLVSSSYEVKTKISGETRFP